MQKARTWYRRSHGNVEAIEVNTTPIQELIAVQERELALVGLTGAALATESAKPSATTEDWVEYGATIAANNQQHEESGISAMAGKRPEAIMPLARVRRAAEEQRMAEKAFRVSGPQADFSASNAAM